MIVVRFSVQLAAVLLASMSFVGAAVAASPCDGATHPNQCGWFDSGTLPPFVRDAILVKGGVPGAGNVLVLTSGDPNDSDNEISNDMAQAGCGTNPDGWETFDCLLDDMYVPPEDAVVVALSSEWFEWYQTIFTDWMTIAGAGVPTVDVSINSWINNKVDVLPYGPMDTGVVILTSLAKSKMVNFRVADSGDHIYDTAIVVVPASWFGDIAASNTDETLLCGNGELEPGEECDDGNTITDDGCSSLCLGTQPPSTSPSVTCGNLVYAWPGGATAPYTCGKDLCAGFRCVVGNTISPACYAADQCAGACAGACVDVQVAQLDCSTMCTVQPAATSPPPPLPQTCGTLVYVWPDGKTMPYTCDDDCVGERCIVGTTVDPFCFDAGTCDETTCPGGTCVETPTEDCNSLCALAEIPAACLPEEIDQTRPAANQHGRCFGNVEICKSAGFWELADGSWEPQDEMCNGLDDDCNGVADDMFETCGDPGLCQNTVNTCDPLNPSVPVECVTLPPPSPVEICNDGLDNDCDGEADDGCECGDDECMPGETYAGCPADCPAPANGTPCEDGDLCTADDAYQNGECIPGPAVTCSADNACVIAGDCNPDTGCTATKVECGDGDPCTIDSCDPDTGCANEPDPACQDGDDDGYAAVASGGTDCDDANPAVHPGAAELCNVIDDDCDTQIDEGFDVGAACQSALNSCGAAGSGSLVCAPDGLSASCNAEILPDPPGYGDACSSAPNACGATAQGTIQCDGSCDAATPPNPVGYGEACSSPPNTCGATGSGTVQCDGSCDAVIPPTPPGYGEACASQPNDCGATAQGTIQCSGSCDAVTPPNPPGYGEACASQPNDCGAIAEGTVQCDGSCDAVTPANPPGYGDACASPPNACGDTGQGTVQCDGSCNAVTAPAADADGDGTPDCLDQCPTDPEKTAPGACGCGVPETASTFYRDADADGFGNPANSVEACTEPSGYVTNNTDCNDSKASVHPGAAEKCNGVDDNCNTLVDENVDADNDGIDDCRADACLGTKADRKYKPPVPLLWLGRNHWVLEKGTGAFVWVTPPQKKPSDFRPTIAYTRGCSCKQILDRQWHGSDDKIAMLGQYLFGCARGTLEVWNRR